MPITDENIDPLKYWGNENPLCPWCDTEIDVHDNELWELYEEEEHDIDCPSCGRTITVSSSATWRFSTDKNAQD